MKSDSIAPGKRPPGPGKYHFVPKAPDGEAAMSYATPSFNQPEEQPIYLLGRIGQRTQMTRAPMTNYPPVLPPPSLLHSRPQLPPISTLTSMEPASLPPVQVSGTTSPPSLRTLSPQFPPSGQAMVARGPPAWSPPFPQPQQRPPPSPLRANQPALYPIRASFQSKNPGTVYEVMSPKEYYDRQAGSTYSETCYPTRPLGSGPTSTYASPRSSRSSTVGSPNAMSPSGNSLHSLVNQTTAGLPSQIVQPAMALSSEEMRDRYILTMRQQPVAARACGSGERDRRVIDPPPVLQLSLKDFDPKSKRDNDELNLNFNVVHCALLPVLNEDQSRSRHATVPQSASVPQNSVTSAMGTTQQPNHVARRLMGNNYASPFVAIDPDGPDFVFDEQARKSTFYIFPDLSCRQNGRYRLRFTLVKVAPVSETSEGAQSTVCCSVDSDVFQVYSAKDFPGMTASSRLIKELKRQGAAVSVRKGKDRSLAKGPSRKGGRSGSSSAEDGSNQQSARKRRG